MFGYLISRIITILSTPLDALGGPEEMKKKVAIECKYFTILAVSTGVIRFCDCYVFRQLTRRVAYNIRCLLYFKILQKNIGWYDLKDNAVGTLTSAMQSDT